MSINIDNMTDRTQADLRIQRTDRVAGKVSKPGVTSAKVVNDQENTSLLARLTAGEMLRAKASDYGSSERVAQFRQAEADGTLTVPDSAIDLIFERMSGFQAIA